MVGDYVRLPAALEDKLSRIADTDGMQLLKVIYGMFENWPVTLYRGGKLLAGGLFALPFKQVSEPLKFLIFRWPLFIGLFNVSKSNGATNRTQCCGSTRELKENPLLKNVDVDIVLHFHLPTVYNSL